MWLRNWIVLSAALLGACAGAAAVEIVDTIPGNYIDISDIGEKLDIGDEGEAVIQTTIGNALIPAGPAVVANNGGVGFNPPSTELASTNEPLPSAAAFGGGQALLPYWDDIGNDVGGVYWHEMNDTLIIQWEDRPLSLNRVAVTFQIQIFDASESSNYFFQCIYLDIEDAGGGAGATIGYQAVGGGSETDQWSFDTPGAVVNGTVLTVLPEPQSLLLGLLGFSLSRRR
jgi:hypothetical protein